MEQVLQKLKNYSRWLQLEANLPGLEDALAEAKALRIEAGGSVRVAQWELERLENPGFFQRLKGDQEERKEEFRKQYRSTQILYHKAQEEVDAEYNEKKGMSYKALPAELFDAPEKIEIGADASGIKVPVSFYAQDMYRSVTDDSNTYALVIRLTSEEGEVYKEKGLKEVQ